MTARAVRADQTAHIPKAADAHMTGCGCDDANCSQETLTRRPRSPSKRELLCCSCRPAACLLSCCWPGRRCARRWEASAFRRRHATGVRPPSSGRPEECSSWIARCNGEGPRRRRRRSGRLRGHELDLSCLRGQAARCAHKRTQPKQHIPSTMQRPHQLASSRVLPAVCELCLQDDDTFAPPTSRQLRGQQIFNRTRVCAPDTKRWRAAAARRKQLLAATAP